MPSISSLAWASDTKKEKAAVEAGQKEIPWLGDLPDGVAISAFVEAMASERTLIAIHFRPDAGCFFQGDDPLLQALRIPELLALHVMTRDPWPENGLFDPFHCNLEFIALTVVSRSVIDEMFLYLADQVEIVETAAKSLIRPRGNHGNPEQFAGLSEQFGALLGRKSWPEMITLARHQLELADGESWQAYR